MPLTLERGAFTAFYNQVKSKFPYKEIKATRSKFYPKWILLKSNNANDGILFHQGYLYPALACTMEPEMVQYLIVTRQAMPLPPDFAGVMDSMFHWGRSINPQWYDKTLELMLYYMRMDDLDRNMITPRQFCFDVIQMRVLQMLGYYFTTNPAAKNEGFSRWVEHFHNTISSATDQTDFFGMAVASIQFTRWVIEDIMDDLMDPVSDDDSAPDATASEMVLPDVVASSP